MKRIATLAATTLLILAKGPVAVARSDSYYVIVCDGVSYERVDAHAIELGGKDDAVAWFGEKHDMDCEPVGPFFD